MLIPARQRFKRALDRVNLNNQAVDFRLSHNFFGDMPRLCVGVGNIFEGEPAVLKPRRFSRVLELRRPWPSPDARFGPIAAVDNQYREENR